MLYRVVQVVAETSAMPRGPGCAGDNWQLKLLRRQLNKIDISKKNKQTEQREKEIELTDYSRYKLYYTVTIILLL